MTMTYGNIKSITKREDGYAVALSTGNALMLHIDMAQDCCEQPGFFMSEDDTSEFIGARLLSAEVVDTALKVYNVSGAYHNATAADREGGGVMFVNLNTSRGVLQFVAYNDHNGYYGHQASVYWVKREVVHSVTL